MIAPPKSWLIAAGLNSACAIIMGAVAAHLLAGHPDSAIVEKASNYQLIHAVALLALASRTGLWWAFARWSLMVGIVLFCGSLYVNGLGESLQIVHAAPWGGGCLIAGWLFMSIAALREK